MRTSPSNPARAPCACCTAWPVPNWGSCTASCAEPARAASNCSLPLPTTTTFLVGFKASTDAIKCISIGRAAIGCSTLCRSDFMRVPLPAARMMAANSVIHIVMPANCCSFQNLQPRTYEIFRLCRAQSRRQYKQRASTTLNTNTELGSLA